MKNIFKSLVGLGLMVSLFGCNPNFPDPNLPSNSTANTNSLAVGAESYMRVDLLYYLPAISSLGRETFYANPASDPAFITNWTKGEIGQTGSGAYWDRSWSARYKTISTANQLIGVSNTDVTLSVQQKAIVKGYAQTVIAYQLLLNLNQFYDNGIKLVQDLDKTKVSFVTKAQAFTEIISKLDEGYANLTTNAGTVTALPFTLSSGFGSYNTPAGLGKVNRAIKARVSAYRGSIASTVDNNSADATKYYADAFAALNASFINDAATYTPSILDDGIYHVFSSNANDLLIDKYDKDSKFWWAHPSLVSSKLIAPDVAGGEKRLALKMTSIGTAGKASYITSATEGDAQDSSRFYVSRYATRTSNVPIIRNEELVLLKAEIAAFNGDASTVTTIINKLHAAYGESALSATLAYAPPLPKDGYPITGSNSSTDLTVHILRERLFSLFAEGHRWIDMRRFNQLGAIQAIANKYDRAPKNGTAVDVIPTSYGISANEK